ncbi:hypothetical protein I2I11_16160 [Pontibacter sp. 172403-2]|uniref:hypothetical protein n=1 Tax=Pontibacter rufus TaxID=2791028 RepID=UPI0018AF9802|nr:hypothetical protein [Pontibacter sp. 172403-2]MBF9254837.1 hypothetical protein [Pontibacter sp. 172403-2]
MKSSHTPASEDTSAAKASALPPFRASPQYKTIKVFDEHLKAVKRETIQLKQEAAANRQQGKQQDLPAEGKPEQKRSLRKGMAM